MSYQQDASSQTLYLAYGSNLSSTQMAQRCPDSPAEGLGLLRGWRWLINDRGYANVVEGEDEDGDDVPALVYGVLYRLSAEDEDSLDMYEGVPRAYEKLWLPVEIVTGGGGEAETVTALVYVDKKRVHPSVPREEYIDRMNRGIVEASDQWGLPEWYVTQVMRPYIPPGTS